MKVSKENSTSNQSTGQRQRRRVNQSFVLIREHENIQTCCSKATSPSRIKAFAKRRKRGKQRERERERESPLRLINIEFLMLIFVLCFFSFTCVEADVSLKSMLYVYLMKALHTLGALVLLCGIPPSHDHILPHTATYCHILLKIPKYRNIQRVFYNSHMNGMIKCV